jgi:dihydropteroate synthase
MARGSGPAWRTLDGIEPGRLHLRPLGLIHGRAAAAAVAAGVARPLAGGPTAFTAVAAIGLDRERRPVAVTALVGEAATALANTAFAERTRQLLTALSTARPPWAGFSLDRPLAIGVVNATPDSFSDGGRDAAAVIAHAMALREAGADILDVGGESTRPGAVSVPEDEEIRRIEPVVRALAASGAVVSIDTRRAAVMAAALDAGARIVNDVSSLSHEPAALACVAARAAPVVLMHMQGEPATMQDAPRYAAVLVEVLDHLEARIAACAAAGIPRRNIVVDPGIGFGKSDAHNLELIAGSGALHALGCGVMLGVSRKSTIANLSRGELPAARLPGSLAAAVVALAQGVQLLRVHDVAETRQALALWDALASS